MFARLIDGGVTLVPLARVVGRRSRARSAGARPTATRRWSIDGFDHVVLACGSIPADGLFRALKHRHPDVHLLGDAYAPRRMVFATRQAWALAVVIDNGPPVSSPPSSSRIVTAPGVRIATERPRRHSWGTARRDVRLARVRSHPRRAGTPAPSRADRRALDVPPPPRLETQLVTIRFGARAKLRRAPMLDRHSEARDEGGCGCR